MRPDTLLSYGEFKSEISINTLQLNMINIDH